MLGFIGIIAGIALALALVVSALLIGTCLLVAWVTDAVRGGSRRGGYDAPVAGRARQNGPGGPVASRQGYPRRDGSGPPVASRRDYR